MGKKLAVVSFLCGAINRRKTSTDNTKKDDHDSASSPIPYQNGEESLPDQQFEINNGQISLDDDQLINGPLPPPPGRIQPHHTRAASLQHHHRRSASAGGLSKLTSSLSMNFGNPSAKAQEECEKVLNHWKMGKKKLGHEDSIWKKTIILGEKCRVPDYDDEDTILHDENGNRISTYRPKNDVGSVSCRK